MRKRSRTIDPSPWPFPGRPRVLIEHPDPQAGLKLSRAVRSAGCTVGLCRGPDAKAHPATSCPVHGYEPCIAVEGADVVVTSLDFDREDARRVLQGLRTRYASTPLVVLATPEQAAELADVLRGCAVLPGDATAERVAAEVVANVPANVST